MVSCALVGGVYDMTCVHCCARLIASAQGDKSKVKAMAAFVEDSIKTHKVSFTMDDVREDFRKQKEQAK